MAGIRNTIDLKVFPLLGIKDKGRWMPPQANSTEGKRKSFADLSQAIAGLSGVDAKRAVEEACAEKKELSPIAWAYMIGKVLNNLDYDATVNQKIMSKIFPNLKIKKPLGRKRASK